MRLLSIILILLSLSLPTYSSDLCLEVFDRVVKYQTIPMDLNYRGETLGTVFGTKVKYFTKEVTDTYKIYSRYDGLVVDINNELVTSIRAKYIMDKYGAIVIYDKHAIGLIHHSSLSRGKPVAGAGYITINKGQIVDINRHSGHYKPQIEQFQQVVKELKRRNFDISKVEHLLNR